MTSQLREKKNKHVVGFIKKIQIIVIGGLCKGQKTFYSTDRGHKNCSKNSTMMSSSENKRAQHHQILITSIKYSDQISDEKVLSLKIFYQTFGFRTVDISTVIRSISFKSI